ncbi:MAG: ribbon-helix-helix protein, CopG family [Rubrobacter sp.]|nr:ribbon-helix-helix protein, CopG family [Rubrobacter sp.]MBA3951258.1 ribbon-helix-helix protein, CopG family [Rubrobacter sp.]
MEKKVRTTVALPEELLKGMDRAVREGRARSRNELLSIALRREISAMERARIDEAFGPMAEDPAYRDEAETVAEEFDVASWEALRSVED